MEDDSIVLSENLKIRLEVLKNDDNALDDLRSEYISIFDHSKSLNPLYETEYGRERAMYKATELSDIAGFYSAFGFQMKQEDEGKDMVDHLSVQLEFYSLLMMKYIYLSESKDSTGCEIVLDGMKKFMNSHLGRFIPAIIEREGVDSSDSYKCILSWADMIVAEECQRIGVTPERATWFTGQTEPEVMCCGGSVAMNK
jgi:TorA maturation chaperone TorD